MNRKEFLRYGSILTAASLLPAQGRTEWPSAGIYTRQPDGRPAPNDRNFMSPAVEDTIERLAGDIADKGLREMFIRCFPNTLDTTVFFDSEKDDTYIITGDIAAMWLRDSTAQVWPYLPLMKEDPLLKQMVRGLINRQAKCVQIDPYANAFYPDAMQTSYWASDQPAPGPGVHERKWEVDSLCYVIRLAYAYWRETGDPSPFGQQWKKAMQCITRTFATEQRPDDSSPYYFIRKTTAMEDAPVHQGTGRPARFTGMLYSMFRPSDDATLFPFLVPSNLFAVQSLRQLAVMAEEILADAALDNECRQLANEIENGIRAHGRRIHPAYGEVYAYETDGFGNAVFMDDANVPSLLSLSYLGILKPDDEIYRNTRKFLLSRDNPWFISGKIAEGNGSPHTGKHSIWPMSIIIRAITSEDPSEIKRCLGMLHQTHAGTYFMHESFENDKPVKFTRAWFAWANTLFGEMVMKVHREYPDILLTKF